MNTWLRRTNPSKTRSQTDCGNQIPEHNRPLRRPGSLWCLLAVIGPATASTGGPPIDASSIFPVDRPGPTALRYGFDDPCGDSWIAYFQCKRQNPFCSMEPPLCLSALMPELLETISRLLIGPPGDEPDPVGTVPMPSSSAEAGS